MLRNVDIVCLASKMRLEVYSVSRQVNIASTVGEGSQFQLMVYLETFMARLSCCLKDCRRLFARDVSSSRRLVSDRDNARVGDGKAPDHCTNFWRKVTKPREARFRGHHRGAQKIREVQGRYI
jgi:hypothetical protein